MGRSKSPSRADHDRNKTRRPAQRIEDAGLDDRDPRTYLVEQSLLRRLGPILGVLETTLYRVDDGGTILRFLNHKRTSVLTEDGFHRVVERIEEVANDGEIPKEILDLLENVRMPDRPCSRKIGDELLICYPLKGGQALQGYFVFQRDREVTAVEEAIISGILEVFSNYYALLDTSQRGSSTAIPSRSTSIACGISCC